MRRCEIVRRLINVLFMRYEYNLQVQEPSPMDIAYDDYKDDLMQDLYLLLVLAFDSISEREMQPFC